MKAIAKPMRRRMSRKQVRPQDCDTGLWAMPDTSGWSQKELHRYSSFKAAITDYLAGERVVKIQERYGLHISQVQEQLWRAMQLDENDRAFGFLALTPHFQIVESVRRKPLPSGISPSASSCKGGLMHLLREERLFDEFSDKVLRRSKGPQPAVVSALDLQKWVVGVLTERGYKATDYPFNTRRPLYSSIARLKNEIQHANYPDHVAANESETAASNLPVNSGRTSRLARPQPYEEVEADEHKLHGIATVRICIDGVDKLIPAERAVGIVIVCRGSGAVLGASVCLSVEAKEEALIEAIRSAVVPGYVVRLPSGAIAPPFRACDIYPSLAGAVWTVMCLDNAKIHTGNLYQSTAAQIGAQSCFGPVRSWSGRPDIENIFSRLVQGQFRKIPSTTGSGAAHSGRKAPTEQALRWQLDFDDLCRIFFEGLAEINRGSTDGLLHQSPADYLNAYFNGPRRPILRRLPPISAANPEVGVQAVRVRVRRRSATNPNMYLSWQGAKYTNESLSVRADLEGQYVIIHPGRNLRSIPAFECRGRPLGDLKADGHWGASDHTIEIRRAVNTGKDARFGQFGETKTPVVKMLEEKAKQVAARAKNRKSGGVVKGALDLVRQMTDASVESISIDTASSVRPVVMVMAVSTTIAANRARQARLSREKAGEKKDE